MGITASLFDAFLKCPTKCWLRSHGASASENAYAEWVQTQNDFYRHEGVKRILERIPPDDYVISSTEPLNLKTAKWRMAADVAVKATFRARSSGISSPKKHSASASIGDAKPQASQALLNLPSPNPQTAPYILETRIHIIERAQIESSNIPAQFIPIRFVSANQVTKLDKLLIGYDSLVLSEVFKHEIVHGKIIHGVDFSKTKVKITPLLRDVRKFVNKIAPLVEDKTPPEIVINRHCPECEFHITCRKKAIEKDDLSLLAGMNEKERTKFKSKGIFTITQLSHTFRPRRRPKRLRDKREKYHHALKALAIRENKIHIIGNPEILIDGTPFYLDVEAIPDRDFYYLIGMLTQNNNSFVQLNLWADSTKDEERIWRNFLDILSSIQKPVLLHYGSFESIFLKHMCERDGGPPEGTPAEKAIKESINILTTIYAQIYFPGFGNGLKDIAGFLGYTWADVDVFGPQSIAWRCLWEQNHDLSIKEKLIKYNAQDCEALKLLTDTLRHICSHGNSETSNNSAETNLVRLDSDHFLMKSKWQKFTSPVPSLELINSAAHWNYQRDRVYARTGEIKSQHKKLRPRNYMELKPETVIIWDCTRICPTCKRSYYWRMPDKSKKLHDMIFGHRSMKLRLVKYIFPIRLCRKCDTTFGMPDRYKYIKKYGWDLIAYFYYHVVDLGIPQRKVVQGFNRLLKKSLSTLNFLA